MNPREEHKAGKQSGSPKPDPSTRTAAMPTVSASSDQPDRRAQTVQPVQLDGSVQPDQVVPAMQGAQHAAQPPKRSVLKSVLSFVITIAAIVLVSYLLRAFVFQSYEIPSSSMEDTIMTGDLVFSEKVTYYFSEPEAGQIVTFEDPEIPSRTLIKRIIATGGQTIDLQDGNVYIDGVRQFEPYTEGKPTYPLQSIGSSIAYPYTVPEGELWVMGDNRTNSQDSRYFGAIPVSSLTGQAVLIYWPLDQFGLLD